PSTNFIICPPSADSTSSRPCVSNQIFRFHSSSELTINFRSSRANFLPDSDIDSSEDEWKRNIWFDTQGRLEVLSAEGGQMMQFVEGPVDLVAGDKLGP